MYIPFVPSTRRSYAVLHPQDCQSQNDKILQDERSNQDHSIKLPGLLALTWMTLFTIIVAGSLGLLIGWLLPRKLQADMFLDGLLRMRSHKSSPYLHGHLLCGYVIGPAGTITSTLHYNKAFTLKPSNATEAAWRSLFPRGRGFFHHPTSGVNISGVAVFHELHCLSAIRLGYYSALGDADVHDFVDSTDSDAALDALNTHVDPSHVRHCFDYLRQTLMCNADTNLEVIDWRIGGSTGWGFERQCRDYQKVVDWAERWRYRRGQKVNDLVDHTV